MSRERDPLQFWCCRSCDEPLVMFSQDPPAVDELEIIAKGCSNGCTANPGYLRTYGSPRIRKARKASP